MFKNPLKILIAIYITVVAVLLILTLTSSVNAQGIIPMPSQYSQTEHWTVQRIPEAKSCLATRPYPEVDNDMIGISIDAQGINFHINSPLVNWGVGNTIGGEMLITEFYSMNGRVVSSTMARYDNVSPEFIADFTKSNEMIILGMGVYSLVGSNKMMIELIDCFSEVTSLRG